jgi:integrase
MDDDGRPPADLIPIHRWRKDPLGTYLSSLAPSSQETMLLALNEIASIVAPGTSAAAFRWETLEFEQTARIRSALAEHAPATANLRLSALRGVLKAARRLGMIPAEAYYSAIAVEPVRGSRVTAGREITQTELAALFKACEGTTIGLRDAGILAVLFGCGLRRAELVGLNIVDFEAGRHLRVLGKGNKERLVPLAAWVSKRITDWTAIRGMAQGPLFYPIGRHGEILARRLSVGAVYVFLQRRTASLGIDHLSPHDFRRTLAGNLLDAGGDLNAVKDVLGHSSVTTTSRYDRRGPRAARKAIDMLRDPSES